MSGSTLKKYYTVSKRGSYQKYKDDSKLGSLLIHFTILEKDKCYKKYLVKFNIHSFLALKKVLKVDSYDCVCVCVFILLFVYIETYTHILSQKPAYA